MYIYGINFIYWITITVYAKAKQLLVRLFWEIFLKK